MLLTELEVPITQASGGPVNDSLEKAYRVIYYKYNRLYL